MSKIFELSKFDYYKEDNRREVKRAKGGLPVALWESYSAFANTYGGVIILGIKELDDRSWKTTGLKLADKEKLLDDFWNLIHNRQKVSLNLLTEKDVETYEVDDDMIIVIHVPMAKRSDKPIYINNNMFDGTYKRTNTGDYKCTSLQVKSMLRDQTENTMDMDIVETMTVKELDIESVYGYRNRHRAFKPAHPWIDLEDVEYLQKIGAAEVGMDGIIHPTAAGLLMFGEEYRIVRQYPEYFLDYRELFDSTLRWTDRLYSSSGEWTGNLFDFYFKVYNKLAMNPNIKVPFKMSGGNRIDDTPVHKALREVLANCLVNTDFFIPRGVVIKHELERIIIENPGTIRVGKYQMKRGGESDPRNKALIKMFNLIGIGERAGSGIPEIFSVWDNEGWEEPIIDEKFEPDRTILELSFKKRRKKASQKSVAKKASQKSVAKKITTKTQKHYDTILMFMEYNKWYHVAEFEEILDLKPTRVKELLRELEDLGKIISDKNTRGKQYKKL
ncbi:hypothetical protein P261_00338 [Lachnospiraceae bacterium TWA4]|nr:hypothetical protein P261_00338 [Lachnospiraceae bacterium TWA4]